MNETIIRFQAGSGAVLTCRHQHAANQLPESWMRSAQIAAIERLQEEGRVYLGVIDTATVTDIPPPSVMWDGAARWSMGLL